VLISLSYRGSLIRRCYVVRREKEGKAPLGAIRCDTSVKRHLGIYRYVSSTCMRVMRPIWYGPCCRGGRHAISLGDVVRLFGVYDRPLFFLWGEGGLPGRDIW